MLATITGLLSALSEGSIQSLMEQAFYPALLGILVIASCGIPIPEDIPLIAAGVILRTHPEAASWPGALLVALVGIMSGDMILYSLGRRWGRNVLSHRSVSWMLSKGRMEKVIRGFSRHGTWMVFVGRFFMGIRAAMCLTAGATHFPFWRFLLADMAGAILSIPAFVFLGYWFAGMLPTLRAYMVNAQGIALAVIGGIILIAVLIYAKRKQRRRQRLELIRAQRRSRAAARVETAPGRTPALIN